IKCGIADYTSFTTREMPAEKWGVLSFDLEKYGLPLIPQNISEAGQQVWYGMPSPHELSPAIIMDGLNELGAKDNNALLWIQHETAIWPDTTKFITTLRELDIPKIVTLHTINFQSTETLSGLRIYQYDLLRELLPCVDAITVFNSGVRQAVITAFPEYSEKVHVLKHGVHSYPDITSLSKIEAKERLNDFLLHESDIDETAKASLYRQRILLDPNTIILGQAGFLCPFKQSEVLYTVKDNLQKIIPHKRIVIMRIGSPREESQESYAKQLKRGQNGIDNFLLETWLPPDVFPLAQRAFDINIYWPSKCTQSGVLAHAFGAGAIVAGRDLEGMGKAMKEAGALTDYNLGSLIMQIRNLILNPEIALETEESALRYANRLSWNKQAQRHFDLADRILHPMPFWFDLYELDTTDAIPQNIQVEERAPSISMAHQESQT
ncbi:MAG: hypothetical protein SVM79_09810, partial [Chloroflexota bacterium]|nr:hypothetical protein [Chloroflexota bacterium]